MAGKLALPSFKSAASCNHAVCPVATPTVPANLPATRCWFYRPPLPIQPSTQRQSPPHFVPVIFNFFHLRRGLNVLYTNIHLFRRLDIIILSRPHVSWCKCDASNSYLAMHLPSIWPSAGNCWTLPSVKSMITRGMRQTVLLSSEEYVANYQVSCSSLQFLGLQSADRWILDWCSSGAMGHLLLDDLRPLLTFSTFDYHVGFDVRGQGRLNSISGWLRTWKSRNDTDNEWRRIWFRYLEPPRLIEPIAALPDALFAQGCLWLSTV